MRKHLSDGKTSQSHPFPPLQLSLVTVETATLRARFDDTHSFTWRRSVDWYIYIMYIHGSYRSVLKFNKVTLWGLRIRGCWWSTRTFSSFEASVLIALSWECGCQSVNWTITLVTFPAPFSTSQFLLSLFDSPLICCSHFAGKTVAEKCCRVQIISWDQTPLLCCCDVDLTSDVTTFLHIVYYKKQRAFKCTHQGISKAF